MGSVSSNNITRIRIPYREGVKIQLFRGQADFFQIKSMHALKTFFIKTIFLYCQSSLSTGSCKMFIKSGEILFLFSSFLFCLKSGLWESEVRGHVP